MKAKRLIVTSSGTPDCDTLSAQHFHREAVKAGYSRCNHHYVITRGGMLHEMRPLGEPGLPLTGALKKYNLDSHSVMLVGTKDYEEYQLASLYSLISDYLIQGLDVISHSDLCLDNNVEDSAKPGFSLHQLIEERAAQEHG